MQDLYKQLGVDEQATAEAIRAALVAAGASLDLATRRAVEFVLLDPGRRAVYDRNRRVLTTIGHLRSRLGMNLRPFWSRGPFRDFTYVFEARAGQPQEDPLAVINAAGGRRWSPRARRGARVGLVLVALVALGVAVWFIRRAYPGIFRM